MNERLSGKGFDTADHHILVVDDDELVRLYISEKLIQAGYKVYMAENGQKAIELCKIHRPHAIVMDYRMPVIDGIAAAKEIRVLPDMENVPIIMLTTSSDKACITNAFDAGISDFVSKPANELVLLKRLESHIKASKTERHLNHVVYHDMLTGLPNRLLLIDHIEGAIGRSRKSGKPAAILFVDLDRFKIINESLGHSTGDRIIEEVAYRIKSAISSIDTAARTSGDEYVVLAENIDSSEDVAVLAQKLIDKIHEPIVINEERHTLNCSIGISMYPVDGENVGSLLSQADTALYRAKEKGGSQFQFYQEVMGERINLRMRLMNAMHEALEKDEFILYYQPQVDVESGMIAGMEALVRWQRSDGTLVSPGDFLPVAEETGMIAQIGEQVIDKACKQVATWRDKGIDVPLVAVNVSARQLVEFDIVSQFKDRLGEYGLPGSQLSVEITETAAMHDPEKVRSILESLKQLGIRLAIDDFGTGYSSLAYLKRFPIDTLKIDRAFIQGLPHDNENVLIVTGMMSLSRNFDMTVVAEGVEEPVQARFLRAQHCNKIQGFLYSRPLPANEIESLLIEGIYFDPVDGQQVKGNHKIKIIG